MQLKDVLKNKSNLLIINNGVTVPRSAQAIDYVGKVKSIYSSAFVGRVIYPQAVKVGCSYSGHEVDGNLSNTISNIIAKFSNDDNPSAVLVQDIFTNRIYSVEARQIIDSADCLYAEWLQHHQSVEKDKAIAQATASVREQTQEVCSRRTAQLREDLTEVIRELFGLNTKVTTWYPSVEAEVTVDDAYKPVIRYHNSGDIRIPVDEFFRLVERIER